MHEYVNTRHCRECRNAYRRAWDKTPKGLARNRRKSRNWYAAHKERELVVKNKWKAAHPLRQMLYNARRDVKKLTLKLEALTG